MDVCTFTGPGGAAWLATGGDDQTVRVWDPREETPEGPVLTGHNGPVSVLAVYSETGRNDRIVSGSTDKTVRVWNPWDESATLVIPVDATVLALATTARGLLIGTDEGHVVIDLAGHT
jgi:WD40 repeat protein